MSKQLEFTPIYAQSLSLNHQIHAISSTSVLLILSINFKSTQVDLIIFSKKQLSMYDDDDNGLHLRAVQ